jgi:predicted short-subunit dehydrogenase-like oxidoreductase (DUF2520 family)
MPFHKIQKIALIGAGKLATNFAFTLKKRGYTILQVFNRSREAGTDLANKVSADYIEDLHDLTLKADLYALAVSDAALPEISDKILLNDQLIIHFSGSADISILQNCSLNYGILYPPQTFTKKRTAGFINVPLCIEANSDESEQKLIDFASSFSKNINKVNSRQRKTIHLSAIFASNFTNFMYAIAEDILNREDLTMKILEPLIEKTKANAMRKNVFSLQTGPAIREDLELIKSHLAILSGRPEFREIYELISKSIIQYKYQNKNDKL